MNQMKRTFGIWLAGLLALATLATAAEPTGVVVVPLKGEISEAQFFFLRRALKSAEATGASAVILDMDTYGGELKAAVEMQDALQKCLIPTVTYINTNAGSAGALVALSTKKIYMAPVSAIGAAAPVSSGGEELSATMSDKLVSYFSGYFRSAAGKNGYNPDIAEAFINKAKEVKIGDAVIHPKGSVLTLSAQEATKMTDGKTLLASGVATSLEELLAADKLGGPVRVIEPTGFEKIAFWITTLAPLFLMIGIIGAYLEFKLQGTLVPGIIAAIAFTIFFAGHYIAGLSGWEVAALFVIGLILVVSELALHPGTIIPGVTGVMLMLGALFWAMIDRYPGDPWVPVSGTLWVPLRNLGLAVVVGIAVIMALARVLPRTSFYHRMVLGTANPGGPSFSKTATSSPVKLHVGEVGVAKSILRPSGNALFGDLHVDVITQGGFVEPNAKIRILAIEGSRIVVEPLG
jgi:membrane-bound serine protease (ClpP class)